MEVSMATMMMEITVQYFTTINKFCRIAQMNFKHCDVQDNVIVKTYFIMSLHMYFTCVALPARLNLVDTTRK